MPRPKPEHRLALAKALRQAARMVERAQNSDQLLAPSEIVAREAYQLLRMRTHWRSGQ